VDIEKHYSLLGHEGVGVTEMDVIFPAGRIYTEYVDDRRGFVEFCDRFSGRGNIHAGLNARPCRFRGCHRRARDRDVEVLQHILFDIEVEHGSGKDLPWKMVERSRPYAEMLCQWFEQRGFRSPTMNMSGNGWHVITTLRPTKVRKNTKDKVRTFFEEVKRHFQEVVGGGCPVKLDSTYDLSRIGKVSGTISRKGPDRGLWRLSQADPHLDRDSGPVPDGKLTSYILGLDVEGAKTNAGKSVSDRGKLDSTLMERIWRDPALSRLWITNPKKPDGTPDRSVGDFVFVINCLDKGLCDENMLHELLLQRPVGKGRVRFSDNYIERTIERAREARARYSQDTSAGGCAAKRCGSGRRGPLPPKH